MKAEGVNGLNISEPTRLLYASTGETWLTKMMEHFRLAISGGQDIRTLTIPVIRSEVSGVFDPIEGYTTTQEYATFVKGFEQKMTECYGVVLPEFGRKIAGMSNEVLSRRVENIFHNKFGAISSQTLRGVDYFRLLTVAGQLAYDVGVSIISPEKTLEAAEWWLDQWREHRGGAEADNVSTDETRFLQKVRELLIQKQQSQFVKVIKTGQGKAMEVKATPEQLDVLKMAQKDTGVGLSKEDVEGMKEKGARADDWHHNDLLGCAIYKGDGELAYFLIDPVMFNRHLCQSMNGMTCVRGAKILYGKQFLDGDETDRYRKNEQITGYRKNMKW
jgi:hypothetical protein